MKTKIVLPADDIEMNEDFKKCINAVENSTQNLFVTGGAGTGKTTLLRRISKGTKKNTLS